MKFLTEQDINERSLEMWEAVNAITDEEIKSYAVECATKRIEEMREAISILEDDEFLLNLCDVGKSVWADDAEFMEKILKLENLLK